MTNVLKISSHDELISSIPHTLGFTPRGVVCLAFGDGPTARLDLPESPEEMGGFLQVLTDVYLRRPALHVSRLGDAAAAGRLASEWRTAPSWREPGGVTRDSNLRPVSGTPDETGRPGRH
jgi:hypothetical protein